MRNEKTLNIIYLLSANPIGKLVFRLFYFLAFSISKFWLTKLTSAGHVYLKGSYATGTWEPVTSDLDFVLVYKSYPPKKDQKIIENLKRFIPLVKDVDLYSQTQLKLRIKYGSYKNCDFNSWKALTKEWKSSASRLSYPKKNILDRIDDIYFYVEWFFLNIPASGKFNSYRLACVRRNLKRIADLVEHLNSDFDAKAFIEGFPLSDLKSVEQTYIWLGRVLDHVGTILTLGQFGKIITPTEIAEVLQREYYQKNFHILDPKDSDEAKLESGKINLSIEAFTLFYSAGSIDSYVLYSNFTKTKDDFLNHLIVAKYYQKIEDGRTNYIHENTNDFELKERFNESVKKLSKIKTFNLEDNYIGKSVFVTASWGGDYLRPLGQTHHHLNNLFGDEIRFLHICIGGEDTFFESLDSLACVRIDEDERYKGLWHKESLYNLSKRILLGAQNVIFSDIDVIVSEKSWWDNLKKKLESTEAVQPFSAFEDIDSGKTTVSSVAALEQGLETYYAPGLIWAFNNIGLKKLGMFFDLFHDGSNDGVLFKKITNANIGVIENMSWTSHEIIHSKSKQQMSYGYIDHTLKHVSHPRPKQYDNMIEFFNIMLPELKLHLERDFLGLWGWKSSSDGFEELYKSFIRDRGFASEDFKDKALKSQDMLLRYKVDESLFYLNEEKKIKIWSPPEELSFFTGQSIDEMGVVCLSNREEIANRVTCDIGVLEEGKNYCFNFLFESSKNLRQNFIARMIDCYSDDVAFYPTQLSQELFHLSVNFYAFQRFENAKLALDFGGEKSLFFKTRSYLSDELDETIDNGWKWLAEDKSQSNSVEKEELIDIKADFQPLWHKLSIKLSGVKSDSYTVILENEFGKPLTSPRIQQRVDDHISLAFRPAFFQKGLHIKLIFEQEEAYDKDIVCYFSEKSF